MPSNRSLKYLFVLNRGSGRKTKGEDWNALIEEFCTASDSTFVIWALPKRCTQNLVRQKIEKLQPQTVVAVGGDGTVTLLAGILSGSGIPLGILPAGSANGMAKELDIHDDPEDAFEILRKNHSQRCDLIEVNEKYKCLHMADLGLNAQLIKYFDEGHLRGMLGYARVIIKTLWHRQKMSVVIRTKDHEVTRVALMVVLANARKYGTGAVINPNGAPDDAAFEVIIVRKLSVRALLQMLFRPGMFNPKHIEILSCTSAEITTKHRFHFQVDGEYIGRVKKISAEVLPGAVRIVVPANARK